MSEKEKVKTSTKIIKAVSLFLLIVFAIVLFIGFTWQPVNYDLIIIGFSGLFISSMLRSFAGSGIIEPKYLTLSELKCNNESCDFKKYQIFKIGDYIYKIIKDCKNCNQGSIIIQNIIHMEEKEAKKLIESEELNKNNKQK